MDTLEPGGLSQRKLRAVALTAAAVIVIVAGGFVYLHSSPPAAPLAVRPADAKPDLAVYDFISPTVAWALGFTDGSSGFSVSRTIDGGKSWQKRLSDDHRSVGVPTLIQFFDAKRGFVANGAGPLLRTSDGGASWTTLSLPAPMGSNVGFRDERHGWLITAIADIQVRAHLYATDDAGDSWHQLPDPPAGADTFAFRGISEAWLASGGPGPPRLYRSFDGGLSWQPREIPVDNATAAGPWNTQVILLPGDGVIALLFSQGTGPGGLIYKSFDGGATWRIIPPEPGRGPLFAAYPDDVNWWTITATTLYRTSDAGQTWSKAADHLPNWLFQPHAIDLKHAWARIGVTEPLGNMDYGLAITSDSGAHWTRVSVPPSI